MAELHYITIMLGIVWLFSSGYSVQDYSVPYNNDAHSVICGV